MGKRSKFYARTLTNAKLGNPMSYKEGDLTVEKSYLIHKRRGGKKKNFNPGTNKELHQGLVAYNFYKSTSPTS